jgi:hypothetical protein
MPEAANVQRRTSNEVNGMNDMVGEAARQRSSAAGAAEIQRPNVEVGSRNAEAPQPLPFTRTRQSSPVTGHF